VKKRCFLGVAAFLLVMAVIVYSRPITIQKEGIMISESGEEVSVKLNLVIRRTLLGQSNIEGSFEFDGKTYYPYSRVSTDGIGEEITQKLKEKEKVFRFISNPNDVMEGLKDTLYLFSEHTKIIQKFEDFTILRSRDDGNDCYVWKKISITNSK